jgi:hypothetical protein
MDNTYRVLTSCHEMILDGVLTTAVARYRDDRSHEMMTANNPNTENLKPNIKSTTLS